MRIRRTRATRGTSFIDVFVGIAITAVTLGIALPQIPALMAPYRLSNASQALAAEFSVARMKSIAQNRRHRVNFDEGAGTFVLERETSANVWAADGGTQALPTGCSFGEVAADPVFETTGMLSQAFSVAVNGSGKSRTVSVNILGNVKIYAAQAN